MSKITDDMAAPDRPVTSPDAKASQAVRSGQEAQLQGRELTETQKVALEESKLPNGGVSPDYTDADAEGGSGISSKRTGA